MCIEGLNILPVVDPDLCNGRATIPCASGITEDLPSEKMNMGQTIPANEHTQVTRAKMEDLASSMMKDAVLLISSSLYNACK